MSTVKLDAQRRLELASGEPGEEYEIQPQGEGRYLLIRVERQVPASSLTKDELLERIRSTPLQPTLSWEELRKLTREP